MFQTTTLILTLMPFSALLGSAIGRRSLRNPETLSAFSTSAFFTNMIFLSEMGAPPWLVVLCGALSLGFFVVCVHAWHTNKGPRGPVRVRLASPLGLSAGVAAFALAGTVLFSYVQTNTYRDQTDATLDQFMHSLAAGNTATARSLLFTDPAGKSTTLDAVDTRASYLKCYRSAALANWVWIRDRNSAPDTAIASAVGYVDYGPAGEGRVNVGWRRVGDGWRIDYLKLQPPLPK